MNLTEAMINLKENKYNTTKLSDVLKLTQDILFKYSSNISTGRLEDGVSFEIKSMDRSAKGTIKVGTNDIPYMTNAEYSLGENLFQEGALNIMRAMLDLNQSLKKMDIKDNVKKEEKPNENNKRK